jgi:hypothetical protein
MRRAFSLTLRESVPAYPPGAARFSFDISALQDASNRAFGLSAQGLPVAAPFGATARAQVNLGVLCGERVNALLLRSHADCPVMAGQQTLAD